MTDLSPERRKALNKVDDMLAEFRKTVSPVATLSLAHTFMTVALNEGESLTVLADKMHSSVPTASRNVLDLGDRNRRKEEGYKLVKSIPNPMNLRENMYSLSPKGRLLADSLIRILEK